MKTVLTKCSSCSGTGLYRGMCEGKGEAVVCLSCNGTGAREVTYEPYTGRVQANGVNTIRLSRGSFIATGVGGYGSSMTYDEFRQKYPEAPISNA